MSQDTRILHRSLHWMPPRAVAAQGIEIEHPPDDVERRP